VSEPDRLLEDIIREIVGDAAVDTVSSLHSARAAATAAPGVDHEPGPVDPITPSPAEVTTVTPAESVKGEPLLTPIATPEPSVASAEHEAPSMNNEAPAPTLPTDADAANARESHDIDVMHEPAGVEPLQSSPGADPDAASGDREILDDGTVSRETVHPDPTSLSPTPLAATQLDSAPLDAAAIDQDFASTPDASAPPSALSPASPATLPPAQAENITTTAVSRETAAEYGGTPLADQIADETRRRIALETAVLPLPATTRVITISNQKGGVGKTTTAVNLAAALARSGAHVLVIDLDPQGNASTALGVDHRSDQQSVYEVLVADLDLAQVVRPSTEHERLDCVPATIHLAGAEIELVSLVAREQRLRRAVDKHLAGMERPYDYVFIDCPPSLGLLTINAFVAAREVLIPIQCEYYALEGLSQLLSNIELIEKHLNPELRLSTILLTMYDSRTNLAQQVAQEVRDHFPVQTLETIIPRSVRVSEAPSYGQSVISYDYSSSGSLSYREAAAEIAQRAAMAAAQKEGI